MTIQTSSSALQTSGPDEIRASQTAFFEAAVAGTLTEADLSAAVELVVEEGEGTGCSIGTNWIVGNPAAFAKIVADATAFIRAHTHVPNFAQGVVSSDRLLRLVPDAERTNLIRAAFVAHGGWRNYVIAWLRVGLKRKQIASIIRARLEAVPADADLPSRSRTFVHEFLEHGAGLNVTSREEMTTFCPWNTFDNTDFVSVIELCARKSPDSVVRCQERLGWKLAADDLARVLALTLSGINSPIEPDLLQAVPLDARMTLCRRMLTTRLSQGTALRLIMDTGNEVTRKRGGEAGTAFFKEMEPVVTCMDPSVVYQQVYSTRHQQIPQSFIDFAWRNLNRNGYMMGPVGRGYHFEDGQRMPTTRWQVMRGNDVYVQDKFQTERRLYEGQQVMFRPDDAVFLYRERHFTFYAVPFTPVNPGGQQRG